MRQKAIEESLDRVEECTKERMHNRVNGRERERERQTKREHRSSSQIFQRSGSRIKHSWHMKKRPPFSLMHNNLNKNYSDLNILHSNLLVQQKMYRLSLPTFHRTSSKFSFDLQSVNSS